MKIFLDTAKKEEVEKWKPIIEGVTTNPTILLKDGRVDELYELCEVVSPLPISLEACEDFVTDARKFHADVPNCNIKIPILKPDGGNNLALIKELSSDGIEINCTCLFSLSQVVMATKAGARYVSLFYGRVGDEGGFAPAMVSGCCEFLLNEETNTELIIGSIRSVADVLSSISNGADIVTIPPSILEKMVMHSFSLETVKMFERDNKALKDLCNVTSD